MGRDASRSARLRRIRHLRDLAAMERYVVGLLAHACGPNRADWEALLARVRADLGRLEAGDDPPHRDGGVAQATG